MKTELYVFVFGVVFAGIGIGVWLKGKLEETHQDIKLPSVYKEAA